MDPIFRAPRGIGGEYAPPPDKSITHRALMLAAVASGKTRIDNALATGDCVSTRRCLESLGCSIAETDHRLEVHGVGLRGFKEPGRLLDAENSGHDNPPSFRPSCRPADLFRPDGRPVPSWKAHGPCRPAAAADGREDRREAGREIRAAVLPARQRKSPTPHVLSSCTQRAGEKLPSAGRPARRRGLPDQREDPFSRSHGEDSGGSGRAARAARRGAGPDSSRKAARRSRLASPGMFPPAHSSLRPPSFPDARSASAAAGSIRREGAF